MKQFWRASATLGLMLALVACPGGGTNPPPPPPPSAANVVAGMVTDIGSGARLSGVIDTGIFSLTKSCKINHDLETIPSNQNTTRRAPHCRV